MMSASESARVLEGMPGSMKGGTSLEHLPFGLDAPVMHALEGLAICIDLIGVVLILFGFFVALIRLVGGLRHDIGLRGDLGNLNAARTILGTYILTGLEFMIASDIVHTVITRELTDLIFVGLLVLIRTAISFFLGREILEIQHENKTAN